MPPGASNNIQVLPGPLAGLQVLLPGQIPQGGTEAGYEGSPDDAAARRLQPSALPHLHFVEDHPFGLGARQVTLERTIIAGSLQGAAVWTQGEGSVTAGCCDVWNNASGDYVGPLAFQQGVNGNIRMDPLFCDPDTTALTIWSDSPCAPFTDPNPPCDLIGAWPVGCTPSAVRPGETLALETGFLTAVPNPFSRETVLAFAPAELRPGTMPSLSLYDPAGRLVRRWRTGGDGFGGRILHFDGTDAAGRPLPAGVYFLHGSDGRVQRLVRVP